MKYFSTFSGIGGFELGIELAYGLHNSKVSRLATKKKTKNIQKTQSNNKSRHGRQSPICVGFSEIDKYAIQVYQKQFPTHKNYGDITKINPADLPDFDCLVGGFPCQSFSIAGKRGGFNDTRGTMFFELARIIKAKRPRIFAFENVKGLLSHDQGNTFSTIINTIDELGYDCQWQVLNSKNHGVPQNRERVFIIGHLRRTARPEVFPFSGTRKADSENVTSTAVDANYWKGIDNHGQRTAIVHNIYGGFKEKKPRVFTDVAPTIRTSAGGGHLPSVLKNARIRRLTPTECERLQGFPDGWTKIGKEVLTPEESAKRNPDFDPDVHEYSYREIEMSDTQRYKMIGNAVTVNVIKDIFSRILPCA